MPTVEQAIRELRHAACTALAADTPLPPGISCVAEHMTLSIAVEFDATGATGDHVGLRIATGPATAQHHLTLEFRIGTSAAVERPSAHTAPQLPVGSAGSGPREPSVLTALAAIFGTPGFDSSARATVFRDALEELSEAQRGHVLASLGTAASPDEEDAVTRARHRIGRLAGSGPAGRDQGPALLSQLAQRVSVETLIQQAAEHWRTPSDWAGASVDAA